MMMISLTSPSCTLGNFELERCKNIAGIIGIFKLCQARLVRSLLEGLGVSKFCFRGSRFEVQNFQIRSKPILLQFEKSLKIGQKSLNFGHSALLPNSGFVLHENFQRYENPKLLFPFFISCYFIFPLINALVYVEENIKQHEMKNGKSNFGFSYI